MGAGATIEAYKDYLQTYYMGYLYFAEQVDKIRVPESDVEMYYKENQESLNKSGVSKESADKVIDVRHILIKPVGDTEDAKTFTDAQWEAARVEAQRIRDLWLAGDADEDSFAQLANEYTQDPGSKYTGGLYTNVAKGKMVTEFNDWIFDESREYGNYGLIKTTYGYHIMFFVESTPAWYATCESEVINQRSQTLLEQLLGDAKVDVTYGNIVLGNVDLAE
jgi:parvulin-like peptidyl-prolyl isomerase